jgi:hypothetical protein
VSGLVDVLDEMQAVIESAYAGGDLDVQVSRRFMLQPTPPCIDLYPGDPSQDESTANMDDEFGNPGWLITVRTRIATADYDATYDWLLETMDDESDLCLPLLFVDTTLNGHAMDVDIRNASGLRAYEDVSGPGAYLGWQFTALVMAAKS